MKIKILDLTCKTRDEVLDAISKDALQNKFATDSKPLFEAFKAREEQGTTGFEDGIAIPHARIPEIKEIVVYVARVKDGLDWPSLDKKKTTVAVGLLVPGGKNAGSEHMELLSRVAGLLIEEKNKKTFKTGTIAQIEKMVSTKKEVKEVEKNVKYDFICISTCPTGVAHTNMAAESMEKYGKENNLKIKVERQGAQGVINPLTDEDIENAKYVVVASSRPADGLERFDGKKVYHCPVAAPIKNPKKVFEDAKKLSKLQPESRSTTAKRTISTGGGAKPMQALMNGISYMIPFVVVGGIFIALSLGLGGKFVSGKGLQVAKNSFWEALLNVGVGGFTLMIPILAGFIASAIGGRSAIAPSMIVAHVVGNSDGQIWNWDLMHFGGFTHSAKLGFLGSIAIGFFVGYIIKLWRNSIGVVMPKALRPVEPIIFIPLVITLVTWAAFSFLISVPLYYIALGLNLGLNKLIDKNLLFLAALIIGAMISFDMGGPLNKIAFLFAGSMITQGKPEIMGMAAAAIAVPPMGMAIGVFLGKIFRNKKFDEDDKANAISAFIMSFVGITEGAIPFAVKYNKAAISANVIGGAIAAAVASLFLISDQAMHGGPIVWVVGAIGKHGITNYAWGLFYLMSILIGAVTTGVLMNIFMTFDVAKPFRISYNKSLGRLVKKWKK